MRNYIYIRFGTLIQKEVGTPTLELSTIPVALNKSNIIKFYPHNKLSSATRIVLSDGSEYTTNLSFNDLAHLIDGVNLSENL